jgi:hypothetical protein
MHRDRTVAVIVVVALLVTIAIVRPPFGGTASAEGPAFRARGRATHLFPGARVEMPVRIRNLESFPVVVTSLAATVGSANAECSGSFLRIAGFSGGVRIPAGGAVRIRIPLELRRSAPPACMGARWPIRFSGKAVRP